jgi:hypothetical protein
LGRAGSSRFGDGGRKPKPEFRNGVTACKGIQSEKGSCGGKPFASWCAPAPRRVSTAWRATQKASSTAMSVEPQTSSTTSHAHERSRHARSAAGGHMVSSCTRQGECQLPDSVSSGSERVKRSKHLRLSPKTSGGSASLSITTPVSERVRAASEATALRENVSL